jgi:signal transduction histidine kinase
VLSKENPISINELEKLLEASEKEKKALLKLALHDIRSPLNKLFALVGLFKMSEEPLTEEQTVYLDKMEMVIRDGLSRMRNIQDLKSIDEDKIEIFYEQINIGNLIQKVIRDQTPDAIRKNIELSFIEKDIVLITDKISCTRILDQILSNAIKFSPKNTVTSIELGETEDELFIHITDGGYGISKEEQKKLFKKFMPLSTRTTGGESITGIGLFIASSMAKNIRGNIEYTNNNKSVFTLRLPKVNLA